MMTPSAAKTGWGSIVGHAAIAQRRANFRKGLATDLLGSENLRHLN
jgi:hypothetical protein